MKGNTNTLLKYRTIKYLSFYIYFDLIVMSLVLPQFYYGNQVFMNITVWLYLAVRAILLAHVVYAIISILFSKVFVKSFYCEKAKETFKHNNKLKLVLVSIFFIVVLCESIVLSCFNVTTFTDGTSFKSKSELNEYMETPSNINIDSIYPEGFPYPIENVEPPIPAPPPPTKVIQRNYIVYLIKTITKVDVPLVAEESDQNGFAWLNRDVFLVNIDTLHVYSFEQLMKGVDTINLIYNIYYISVLLMFTISITFYIFKRKKL